MGGLAGWRTDGQTDKQITALTTVEWTPLPFPVWVGTMVMFLLLSWPLI